MTNRIFGSGGSSEFKPVTPVTPMPSSRRVNPTTDKQQQGQSSERRPPKFIDRNMCLLSALLVIQILFHTEAVPRSIDQLELRRRARRVLISFLTVIEILTMDDCSLRPDILMTLSHFWRELLEVEYLADQAGLRSIAAPLFCFRSLIEDYPPEEQISLGNYLTQGAGRDWYPLPFLTAIQHIFHEHQAEPTASAAHYWKKFIEHELNEPSTLRPLR